MSATNRTKLGDREMIRNDALAPLLLWADPNKCFVSNNLKSFSRSWKLN
jgi:hypothetical protein